MREGNRRAVEISKARTGLRYIGTILKGLPAAMVFVAVSSAWGQVGPAPGVQLQDEGANQGRVQILNCIGSTVACAKSGVTGTITISGGGSGYATIEDEAVARTQRAIVNFTGAGVSCVDDGSSKTVCTISGGGAGSANVVEVSVSLGTGDGLYYSTAVAATWVTASSSIACSPLGVTTDGQTPETVAVSGVIPTVSDRSAGVGFNLNVYSPNGGSGVYRFGCTGA